MRSLVITAAALVLVPHLAGAEGTSFVMSHNGRLVDASDRPVTDAALAMSFRIYDQSLPVVGETLAWQASCPVNVKAGNYAITLGETCGTPLDATSLPLGQRRFLEVSVAGQALHPRMQFATVPAAAVAGSALTLNGESAAQLHDASRLTGVAPPAVLGTGSSAIATVGTITAGVWNGTPIADAHIASASAWNAKLAAEADPRVGTLEAGRWCASDGSRVICDRSPPVQGDITGGIAIDTTAQIRTTGALQANSASVATLAASTIVLDGSPLGAWVARGQDVTFGGRNVGVGTTAPATRLDVAGQIRSSVRDLGSATTVDWNEGNVQYTSAGCGAFTFKNMLEGGSYTLGVTGSVAGTCSFTQTDAPDRLAATDFRFVPANGPTQAGKTTVFTFLRFGNKVYVSWISGF